MNLRNDMRQKNTQVTLDFDSKPTGEARQAGGEATESFSAEHDPESPASTHQLMEEVCERENLKQALQRVKTNKGSPGIDGMTVEELSSYLQQHGPAIREQLLNGT
jgi:RNA-directed DNA polymerase